MMKMKMYTAALLVALCLEGNAQSTISVSQDASLVEYDHKIFGQFIEHFDNQIYGGIFDPGNPLSDEDGFRKDVIEALRDIKTGIVRWPGGCFASTYHWMDGIGPERIPTYDKTWQAEDPNTFGTDEFVKWCSKVGAEPFICTNAGTGTPEEMSDWMEYCNLNVGKYARMRKANGHAEPYDVKYWSVGNENWGAHELGARTVSEWGPLVRESAKLMRSVTKDALLFAAATSDRTWTLPLLQQAGPYIDYVSIHGYWDPLFHVNNPAPFVKCMMKTELPEKDICQAINILDEAGFGGGRIKIAYDEWNLRNWHHPWHGDLRRGFVMEDRRKNDIASTYTMADALFSACFLNACLRHADIVKIACFSPIVNTRGALFVHKDGILKRTTYHVLYMYSNLLEDYVVPVNVASETMTFEGESTTMLDAVLTVDKERKHYVLAVVNKHPDKAAQLKLDLPALGKLKASVLEGTVLSGQTPDDYNDLQHPDRVTPVSTKFKVKDSSISIPAHSLAFIRIDR